MEENNAVTVVNNYQVTNTPEQIRANVNLIQNVMVKVMHKGTHFDTIPGCGPKPTLLKSGAEKLCSTFLLAPDPVVEDLSTHDERRYRIKCRLIHSPSGTFMGSGIGECSSEEEKYKWRKAVSKKEFEATPDDRRRIKYTSYGEIEQVRTNIADVANTVLKMAKKRALVDGTLTVTGASDMFTQDIEDMEIEPKHPAVVQKAAPLPDEVDLEAKAAAAKEQYKATEAPKSAPAKPQGLPEGVKLAKGIITNVGAPNGGGYVSISVEGHQREDGKDKLFSTKNDTILDAISEHVAAGTPIEFTYTDNANPRFASSIVELIA